MRSTPSNFVHLLLAPTVSLPAPRPFCRRRARGLVPWALAVASCNQGASPKAPAPHPAEVSVSAPRPAPPPAAPELPPPPQSGAVISGRACFVGKPPAVEPQPRGSDPFCAGVTLPDDSLVIDSGGGLRSVFVRVLEAAGGPYQPPRSPVLVTQSQCRYLPRITGVVRGQPVLVSNSDGTLHNVHALVSGSTVLNQIQMNAEAPRIDLRPVATAATSNPLQLRCDIHPWMSAYLWIVEHPFFAVTADDGSFAIKNLPAGEYTLEAWHERLGTRRSKLTVSAAAPAAMVEFRFNLEPAEGVAAPAKAVVPAEKKSARPATSSGS